MQTTKTDSSLENWHNFEIESRREVITLLRAISANNQLVRLLVRDESDVCVTSILAVDPERNMVILDRSPNQAQHQRILAGRDLWFDTTLDKIRILFTSARAEECMYARGPALKIALPTSVIRLQRRELYRMPTPLSEPLRVVIALPPALGGGSAPFPLADISCGGVSMLDNRLLLGKTIGKNLTGCRIDLPDDVSVSTTLQIRNAIDVTSANNRVKRRLGCQFVDIARPMLSHVQRYIIKLERERNARLAGRG